MNKKLSILMLVCINLLTIGADVDDVDPNLLFDIITENAYGLYCITEVILEIEDAAGDFTHDLTLCDDPDTTKKYIDLVYLTEDIAQLTSRLLFLNDELCKNPAYMPGWNALAIPSELCMEQFKKHLIKMKDVFEETVKAIKKVDLTDSCAVMAIAKFGINLQNFEEYLLTCTGTSEKLKKLESEKPKQSKNPANAHAQKKL